MPDLISIEVVGRAQAGNRVKKYHVLEDSSSNYTFQRVVKVISSAAVEETAGAAPVPQDAAESGKVAPAGNKAKPGAAKKEPSTR